MHVRPAELPSRAATWGARALLAPAADARLDPDALASDAGHAFGARQPRAGRLGLAAHRAFDLLAAAALLLLTLPVLALAALAVRLDGPGPVIYRQERVGKDGRVFTLLKLRTMAADAEADGRPRWAAPGDPRVTRVGRLLRLTRLDELPQLINVLRGDMAVVGPRPERPAFVAELRRALPGYDARHAVRPGLTGWAQVNHPYGASVEDAREKLAYDLWYLRHRTLALDLLVLAATARVVLLGQGAR